MLRAVMTVDAIKQFDGHTEKTCRFPLVDAGLHEPSRIGVAQRVWRNLAVEVCLSHGTLESGLHRFDRLTIPRCFQHGLFPNQDAVFPSHDSQPEPAPCKRAARACSFGLLAECTS